MLILAEFGPGFNKISLGRNGRPVMKKNVKFRFVYDTRVVEQIGEWLRKRKDIRLIS
jgi:hypothetical protein